MTTSQAPGTLDLEHALPAGGIANSDTVSMERLRNLAALHPASSHPLFARLVEGGIARSQVAAFLRNYDAHASCLRRLLLFAATIMPEEVVGYILENVRNEYGNGDPAGRHQLQLIDLAGQSGVCPEAFATAAIQPGITRFIEGVRSLYYPSECTHSDSRRRAAIAAGAITATELLAIKEFECMQAAFTRLGLRDHIWFDHVTVEAEHSDESLSLALFFINDSGAVREVERGLHGVLDLNIALYDGLMATLM